ncbi:MAG: ABC transporter ATP-binding protein [Candidatus Thermoplasmatota archaeon]|nr:ABC transporter ATP-binding protein [Candidatus Thermoplasmatota archaeon]
MKKAIEWANEAKRAVEQRPIITVHDVVKKYSESVFALNGVSLNVKKGDWLTIVGPSGSGKTTLMNMLGGLDRPTSGSLVVDGTDITKLNEQELTKFRRERFGYIFQQFHLVPYLSALENAMLAQYFKNKKSNGQDNAAKALETVGLGHRLGHVPGQLSGGEQQRVAIARALVNKPEILFADEPTGNLDQKTGMEIMGLLAKLNAEGRTIVMITHDEKIAQFGSRMIKMVDGKVVKEWRKVSPLRGL